MFGPILRINSASHPLNSLATSVSVDEAEVVLQDTAGGMTMADASKSALLDVVDIAVIRAQILPEELTHPRSVARDLDLRQEAVVWERLNSYEWSDTLRGHCSYTSIEVC
jgi:hypothetical protein